VEWWEEGQESPEGQEVWLEEDDQEVCCSMPSWLEGRDVYSNDDVYEVNCSGMSLSSIWADSTPCPLGQCRLLEDSYDVVE